ncbi:MAG: flagellar biosynthetic protein FliR [Acidimicrobiia bacterium]|nr:flagellar biosynthetic protein FliR [Acidimicrobiia bacterium]
MPLDIVINGDWVAGMLLASIRVAGFVIASPIFKAFPATGRMVLVIVLGYTFADPIAGSGDIAVLLVGGFTNAVVGLTLGFLTGIIFYLFTVGGALIDFTSSLSAAAIFDPISSNQVTIFGRIFNIMAIAMFLLLGGDRLLVAGIGVSFDAVAVTGTISLAGGLGDIALGLMGRMMIAAIELAMPALAALFIAEVVLGIAARFAPQSNVFLIGLPVKIFAALASIGAVLLLVPETLDGVLGIMEDTFRTALLGM